jgi:hypothetical protein
MRLSRKREVKCVHRAWDEKRKGVRFIVECVFLSLNSFPFSLKEVAFCALFLPSKKSRGNGLFWADAGGVGIGQRNQEKAAVIFPICT